MKRIMFVLGTLLLAVSAITLSSFTTKSFKKNAFSLVCFYYTAPTYSPPSHPVFKRVVDLANFTDDAIQVEVEDVANWAISAGIVPPIPDNGGDCTDGAFLCAICYDSDTYSKKQAIDLIFPALALGDLSQGQDIGTSPGDVQVYLQSNRLNQH